MKIRAIDTTILSVPTPAPIALECPNYTPGHGLALVPGAEKKYRFTP